MPTPKQLSIKQPVPLAVNSQLVMTLLDVLRRCKPVSVLPVKIQFCIERVSKIGPVSKIEPVLKELKPLPALADRMQSCMVIPETFWALVTIFMPSLLPPEAWHRRKAISVESIICNPALEAPLLIQLFTTMLVELFSIDNPVCISSNKQFCTNPFCTDWSSIPYIPDELNAQFFIKKLKQFCTLMPE